MTPETAEREVTAALLCRAADVLQTCADTVVRIEGLLDLIGHPVIEPSQRLALQEFDRLGQQLVDLSLCLGNLAGTQAGAVAVDRQEVLAPLRLHDLRLFLAGRATSFQSSGEPVSLF